MLESQNIHLDGPSWSFPKDLYILDVSQIFNNVALKVEPLTLMDSFSAKKLQALKQEHKTILLKPNKTTTVPWEKSKK